MIKRDIYYSGGKGEDWHLFGEMCQWLRKMGYLLSRVCRWNQTMKYLCDIIFIKITPIEELFIRNVKPTVEGGSCVAYVVDGLSPPSC